MSCATAICCSNEGLRHFQRVLAGLLWAASISLGIGLALSPLTAGAEDAPAATKKAAQVKPMSQASLQLLVSGIAMYPDEIIEQLFDAALHPVALRQAANPERAKGPLAKRMEARWPESVKKLAGYKELLEQLD